MTLPSSSDRPVVLLLAVHDVGEEKQILANLDAIEATVGAIALPVLDRDDLIERITNALERAGAVVQVRPLSDPGYELDCLTVASAPGRARPERGFSAGKVDLDCLHLAATFVSHQPRADRVSRP